jgi:glycosyltransferase involved in cell wall biosynthesis
MLTIVIPSYNNIEYLKLCYNSIRESDSNVKLIIFNDGSSDGTTEWLESITDENLQYETYEERIGHTILYDKGFQMAQTEYVGILHADMVVSKNTIPNIIDRLERNTILSVTCIEPPIHPEGAEKVQMDFGMYPNEFKYDDFTEFCKTYGNDVSGQTHDSLFAPWFIHKEEYMNRIGKHDTLFAPYGWEDSDIFVRMALADFDIVRLKDTFVYHFTQRGHKWKNGQLGDFNSDYKKQMMNMQREFIRKWGTDMCRDNEHRPVKILKYDIGLVLENAREDVVGYLEPYFSTIYCDTEIAVDYLSSELRITNTDINTKFKPLDSTTDNDIVVKCNCDDLLADHNRFQFLTMLPMVITDTNSLGKFRYDVFDISVNKLTEYQNSLVKL